MDHKEPTTRARVYPRGAHQVFELGFELNTREITENVKNKKTCPWHLVRVAFATLLGPKLNLAFVSPHPKKSP